MENDEKKIQEVKDELDELIVNENEPIDKKILAEIVRSFVISIGKNEIIHYTERFEKSSNWIKMLVYLCCRKIMFIKNIIEKEEVGPKEIAEKIGIPLGTAKDISRDKNLKNLVVGRKSSYSIPNYNLKKIKNILIENETNTSK